jgi:hypothetical protein
MSNAYRITIIVLIEIFTAGISGAMQSSGQATPSGQAAGPKNGITFFWADQAQAEQTIAGSPFSATVVIETRQTLVDGNRFVNHSTQKLARDSKGRIRREQTIGKIGGLQLDGPTLVFIYDPVAQVEYTLDSASRTARVSKLQTINLPGIENSRPASAGVREHISPTGKRSVLTDPLGSQVIDGFEVEGTRRTVTFPAGVLGNEQPFSTSVENWFSPVLHADVLRKRTDPRVGETVYRLTDIRPGDPDPSLFQVPAGYKTVPAAPSLPRRD